MTRGIGVVKEVWSGFGVRLGWFVLMWVGGMGGAESGGAVWVVGVNMAEEEVTNGAGVGYGEVSAPKECWG